MDELKSMKQQLTSIVQSQFGQIDKVNSKELGEAIDMIKDLAMTMYYCSIVDAMEKSDKSQENMRTNSYYYTERYLPYPEDYRMYDYYNYPRQMYYGENNSSSTSGQSSNSNSNSNSNQSSPTRGYHEYDYPMMKDAREGRSGPYRKMYMESKQTSQDSVKKIQELENYMKELTSDITEMIQDASPEEKAVLQKKMNTLANKIQNV